MSLGVTQLLLLLSCTVACVAQTDRQHTYTPSAANLAARERFRDLGFGMFIHWGVYAQIGGGEWVMERSQYNVPEYEALAESFEPTAFNASGWAALAKASGCTYITFTTKHHDGFAMWHTKVNKWNAVDATPFKRDILRELADACKEYGLRLFAYYSPLDWHHTDYYPLGNTGWSSGRPDEGNFDHYLDDMDAQIKEVLTEYGEIDGIWLDGHWDRRELHWGLEQTYSMIHKLRPEALIANNHHLPPFPGEDFQVFEKDLPGENTQGWNDKAEVDWSMPLEVCETISIIDWGYNANEEEFKPAWYLIKMLVRASGKNANLLLNVGPRGDGVVQPELMDRMNAIGSWNRQYGYTTKPLRGGPFPWQSWGVSTHNATTTFVHIIQIDFEGDRLVLPPPNQDTTIGKCLISPNAAERVYATMVTNPAGRRVRMRANSDGRRELELPAGWNEQSDDHPWTPVDTIIRIDCV